MAKAKENTKIKKEYANVRATERKLERVSTIARTKKRERNKTAAR